MPSVGGFWSYAHADDTAESGRIAQLARDVVAQYEMITGDSIDLFLDRDNLEWGDEWKPKIDATLSSVAFFIAILSPRYFQSEECRRELNFFARRASELGVKDLVLPILYVDIAAFREDSPSDPLISLTRSFQWVDWTDLRFAALDSPDYRRAVANLASRLAQASLVAESVDTTDSVTVDLEDDDDTPGFIDLVAQAEYALPQWTVNIQQIAEQINFIAAHTSIASEKIKQGDAKKQGMAARVAIFTALADDLSEPASQLEKLSGQFSSLLQDVDSGMTAIFDVLPEEIKSGATPPQDVADFLTSIRYLTDESEEGLGSLEIMVEAIQPAERNSRNLRPVMRKLRKALTLIAEGRNVMRAWAKKMDSIDPYILAAIKASSAASNEAK